jgi:DNA-binding MarR family transcriptional regulator
MTGAPALPPPGNQCEVVVELTRICPSRPGADDLISRQTELLREQLGSALRIVDQLVETPVVRLSEQPISEMEVRALLKLRRNRDHFFGEDLFADPAWDILLELYAASLGQFRVSVTSLCAGAAVPATTALRWISHLEQKGMINRKADPTDGRRHFLMLSNQAIEAMNGYFRTLPPGASLI